MRLLKATLLLVTVMLYVGALWVIFRLPKDFTNILEERGVAVSVVTSVFGALVAVLIALNFFLEVRHRISEFYSKAEHLKQSKMTLDEKKMSKLGLGGHGVPTPGAVMRYCTGCIKRERERLARIFVEGKPPEKIAGAILDDSLDENVFKWNGPEATLDDLPIPYEERMRKRQQEE